MYGSHKCFIQEHMKSLLHLVIQQSVPMAQVNVMDRTGTCLQKLLQLLHAPFLSEFKAGPPSFFCSWFFVNIKAQSLLYILFNLSLPQHGNHQWKQEGCGNEPFENDPIKS